MFVVPVAGSQLPVPVPCWFRFRFTIRVDARSLSPNRTPRGGDQPEREPRRGTTREQEPEPRTRHRNHEHLERGTVASEFYWYRNAINGFTVLARRAGSHTATNETIASSTGIPMNTAGSRACTP